MSPLAWLRGLGRVVWQVPPHEPAGADLAPTPRHSSPDVDAAIHGVDMRLAELTEIPAPIRNAEEWNEIDRLLERRMRLARRPVPVPRDRFDEYWENPW